MMTSLGWLPMALRVAAATEIPLTAQPQAPALAQAPPLACLKPRLAGPRLPEAMTDMPLRMCLRADSLLQGACPSSAALSGPAKALDPRRWQDLRVGARWRARR